MNLVRAITHPDASWRCRPDGEFATRATPRAVLLSGAVLGIVLVIEASAMMSR